MTTPPAAPSTHDTLSRHRERMRQVFGYPDFRGGQPDVLRLLDDGDVLAVMPTGSGKSLCYVLPALDAGRTLVVSPLIALMQDQVEGLQQVGVAASFINSNLGRDEQNARYLDFIRGKTALLYVAPERLANQRFVEGLRRVGLNLLAIDEAHCISEWGHDFRPDYLSLGAVREQLGMPRTLALTATADPRVRSDIRQRLGIASAREVVTSVDRPNLRYASVRVKSDGDRQAWLRRYVVERKGQAGIVYAGTRKSTEELAEELRRVGVRATAYHAGMGREERATAHRRFTTGETPVIVATNAFGMGIDKPDVRYVVHYRMPGRLEAYYQEAGRAGRDGDPAECTLLYAPADRQRQQRFIDESHPDDGAVRDAWRRMVERQQAINDGEIAGAEDDETFAQIVAALRASGLVAPVGRTLLSTNPEAPIDTRPITEHRRHAEARLAEMTEYAETSGCRRAMILRYFGEDVGARCEGCDNCLGLSEGGAPSYPEELYAALLAVRDRAAERSGRDPLTVLDSRAIRELATYRPHDHRELLEVRGIGEVRVRWLGDDVLAAIEEWQSRHPDVERPHRGTPSSSMQRRPNGIAEASPYDDISPDDPVYRTLREWRAERARRENVPAYTIFSDRTLRELAGRRPRDLGSLLQTWGLGSSRVERFGQDLLGAIAEASGTRRT